MQKEDINKEIKKQKDLNQKLLKEFKELKTSESERLKKLKEKHQKEIAQQQQQALQDKKLKEEYEDHKNYYDWKLKQLEIESCLLNEGYIETFKRYQEPQELEYAKRCYFVKSVQYIENEKSIKAMANYIYDSLIANRKDITLEQLSELVKKINKLPWL